MDLTYHIDRDGTPHAQPTEIFLAKPGQRILGVLNGVQKDSAHLDINLNNTCELTFTVNRVIGGYNARGIDNTYHEGRAQISSYYDSIEQLYELYLPGYGWFKINEEPEIVNDGNTEVKNVRAESLEIELQQYDLVGFKVNTGTYDACEYLAVDNTYKEDDYVFFRDQVLLYRDTSELEELMEEFDSESMDDFKEFVKQYPTLFSSWRISIETDTFRDAVYASYSGIDAQSEATRDRLRAAYGQQVTKYMSLNNTAKLPKDIMLNLCRNYPDLYNHIDVTVDATAYDIEDGGEYEPSDIIYREIQRLQGLSLLTVILKDHDWGVGFVDDRISQNPMVIDDTIPLTQKIGKFEIDNQDVYSFITQDMADYYRCIFVFDTERRLVNVFNVNYVGFDTNIFLSFHNIQNQVTRSSDTQIKTVFHVRGDDNLAIRWVNFGDDSLEDISYYLNRKHFSKDFIRKYNNWQNYREARRKSYMDISREYQVELQEIYEVEHRVPVDGADPEQYKTFTYEELDAELENYRAELAGYEDLYVDEWGEFDQDALQRSKDWANYKMIKDIVIPNIEIEIENRGHSSYAEDLDFNEDYKLNFDLYGDSYGLEELKTQLDTIKGQLAAIEKEGYGTDTVITDKSTQYDKNKVALYNKYLEAKASCERAIAIRQSEYDAHQDILNNIQSKLNVLRDDCEIENPHFEFTKEELTLLDRYRVHTDYINENILITSIYTPQQVIDASYELYKYAVEELYAEAHPQYTWTTSQNNLLLMPEFHDWHGVKITADNYMEPGMAKYHVDSRTQAGQIDDDDYYKTWRYTQLWVGNFIRVALREDDHNKEQIVLLSDENEEDGLADENGVGLLSSRNTAVNQEYQEKLRIIQIGLNPFLTEPEITMSFSNFINYKSQRNDLASIIGTVKQSEKNAIKTAILSTQKDDTFNVDSGIIMKLVNNGVFQSYLGNAIGGHTGSIIQGVGSSMTNGELNTLLYDSINDRLTVAEINVGQIVGDRASFNELFSTYINSEYIYSKMLTAEEAEIEQLRATMIDADHVTAALLEATDAQIDNLKATIVTTDVVTAAFLDATEATIKSLSTDIITVGKDGITQITEDTIRTATIEADQINVTNAFVEEVLTIGTDTITTIAEGAITTESIVAGLVEGTQGDFDNLDADTAFIQYLNSGVIEVETVTAEKVITAVLEADAAELRRLTSDSAFIQYLNTVLVIASEIRVDDLMAKMAQIDVADIEELYADNAFVDSLQTLSSTTATSVINDAYIYNAVAGKITVADLAAGDITLSNSMRILSGNGNMVMNGSSLQIFGEDGQGNPYVGVQLGYDTGGEPSLILRNSDGATVLTPNGITQDAVADGLIVNNMIRNGTISENKLSFNVMKTGDSISIEQVTIGGGSFGTEYTQFKNGTNQSLQDLRDDIDEISTYTLYIETPNGTNIYGGNIQLVAKLMKDNMDVTSLFDPSCFIWTRTSRDTAGDAYWNAQHTSGSKTLTLTASDVRMNADFQCKFEYTDGN